MKEQLREYFEVRFRAEKYGVPYFLAESEAIALRPTERGRRRKSAERGRGVRLRVRTNSRVKVPIGQKHWSVRSGRQLRRREAGWRAAGSERPVHKQNDDELDSA